MDFTFLPKTSYREKSFIRYTIRSKEISTTETAPIRIASGFYYVGKNSVNIEKLVKLYKRGYASDSIDNARAELKRSIEQEKNIVPEVIFCESSFDFVTVKAFVQFLRSHSALSNVPFIIDSKNLCDMEMGLYKKHMLADDIIEIDNEEQTALLSKVRFLNKVKAKSEEISNAAREEEALVPSINIHSILKRSFDILVSSTALLFLSPIFLMIAIAIRIESRGSIFYIAKRAGRGYRIFDFYKFRTMFTGADKQISELSHLNQYGNGAEISGPSFIKINNDPRITKVGAFLRNSSLDELPQLLNVLMGDMSLVGNRPLPLYEAVTLTTDQCAQRFLAPAGITGLWQIKKRGQQEMSVEERINLDIDYANKYNFMYDLWIMANTPSALIQKSSV
jgi:lipopolysaccharide/colanic/teichoic acid biosynthesis glycosyltransferase